MPENKALWLPAKRAAFNVGPAPYTAPKAGEVVIRTRAVAINPIDWILQTVGDIAYPWLRYPAIVGFDAAGEVVEVGSGVTRFKVGDRVLGLTTGTDKARNTPAEAAFQRYTLLLAHMAAPVPESMSFETAAVLPLGLSTAAAGLFQDDFIALDLPSSRPRPTGEAVLIWGGSTSVGCNAIQLALAAGYEVVATASPKNFNYLKTLGAKQVFDYRSPTVVKDVVRALKGKTLAGALAIGIGGTVACVQVSKACKGKRFVAVATPPISFNNVPRGRGRLGKLIPAIMRMLFTNIGTGISARFGGVKMKHIVGTSISTNAVGPAIFQDFLPSALAERRFVAAPEPVLAGNGLEQIPAALERHRVGVSASKLVVTL
jgi:NADPH:quinone reductase-like Zn-dependent oxidoreductase